MGDPVTPFMILLLVAGVLRVGWTLWAQSSRKPIPVRPSEPFPDDPAAAGPPDDPDGSLPERGARDSRLAAAQEILEREQPQTQTLEEFLERPQVLEIIEWLRSSSWNAEELYALYSGSHILVACAATRALAQRPDGATVVARVLETMSRFHLWTRLLALQLLDTHTPPPAALIGPILMAIDESWSTEEGIGVLVGFARSRSARGEPLTFGGALETATRSRVDIASQYADKLGEAALPLRDELRAARAQLLDEVFLQSFGRLWPPHGADGGPAIVQHAALVTEADAVERALRADPPHSVLLVGEHGVGKTTLARVALARLQQSGWRVFEAAPEELNADQKFIGALEGRVQQLVREIDRRKQVIWLIRDFPALTWTGISMHTATSALDMLLPAIQRGDIIVLGTAAPAMHERMLLAKPRVRAAIEERRIAPLDREATINLVRSWLAEERARGAAPPVPDSLLHEAWNLTRQYGAESAPPGNLFRLLHGALRRRPLDALGPAAAPLAQDELIAALSAMTGLPVELLDDRERLDLPALRRHFEQQLVGQPEAIDCLVERLAMIRAGVTDPSRPLGVFLFVGPTGTGKTEMAKALAAFVFSDAARMIRLDMSELANPDAIGRIVGEPQPDSAQVALVDQIRMQPFSVLLLDEFEKAHPAVWDLFLQVFDDGRLTDRRGRTADFRHTIIIMTSNLGGQIPAGSTVGFTDDSGQFSAASVDRAVGRAFRKEFFNRIDRVVVFRPLTRDTMREVLKKQLRESFNRRGLRNRQWAVEWDAAALEFLLERGFTLDLGARPLQRAIERYVLAPLARTIVDHEVPHGDQFLFVHREGDGLSVEFVDPDLPPARAGAGVDLHGASATEAIDTEALTARVEALGARVRGAAWRSAQSRELELTGLNTFWTSPERFTILDRIEYRDRITHALPLAESLLTRLRGSDRTNRGRAATPLLERLSERLQLLETACSDVEEQRAHDAFVSIEATSDAGRTVPPDALAFARKIGEMYRFWSDRRGMRVAELERAADGTAAYRLLLSVSGFGAHALLVPEDGWHLYEAPSGKGREFDRWPTRVRIAPQPFEPAHAQGIDLAEQARRALAGTPPVTGTIVRHYRESPSPLVRDHVRGYRTGRLDLVLGGHFDQVRPSDE